MKKTKVVVFTKNNARILVGVDPKHYPGALVNPDLSAVRRVPTHFWKVVRNQVVPMNALEKRLRLADHAKNGVDNEVGAMMKRPRKIGRFVWGALAGAGSGLLAWWLA